MVYVAYGVDTIDLAWIPPEAEVVVVHNDDRLAPTACDHPRIRHVGEGENVGFGAGVNAGLAAVTGGRTVIVNPDTALTSEHWAALADGPPEEVRTVEQHDRAGIPTSVVNRYPTPASLLLTGYRASRLLGARGTRRRRLLTPLLGRWGRTHERLQRGSVGTWPLVDYWVSGAAFSVATERLRVVGGFDERYFLYLEDVDLSRRLAARFPDMRIHVVDCAPAVHGVGGSSTSPTARRAADLHALESAIHYTTRHDGLAWSFCRAALRVRRGWLRRRVR